MYVWQEETKIVPANGASCDYFGSDVALYVDTAIIGSPIDDDMGIDSGNMKEVQKLTPTDEESDDWFGCSVCQIRIHCCHQGRLI